jgi:uncharacterized protein (TIGR02300 family)
MARPELGTKRVCVSCQTKFYDLQKVPAVCPKCGTEQPADQPRVRRGGGNVIEDRRPKKVAVVEDAETEAEPAEDEAEEVLEDASDLEDEGDAIEGEIEVEPDGDENER